MDKVLKVIKKNPLSFIKILIFVEVGGVFIYFLAGLLGHYSQIYRSLPIADYLSFQIAQALFIFTGQTLILVFMYFRWLSEYKTIPDIGELLSKEENEHLEFKSSFRWDIKGGKVNKLLEKATMKTIAAFLNTQGGHLVIGVDDSKNILGMEKDMSSLAKPNVDGFESHFTHVFHSMIGPTFRNQVKLAHFDVEGKPCFVVSVNPSLHPVYLRLDDDEEFYIRTGNGTTALKLSEATKYIRNRFKKI